MFFAFYFLAFVFLDWVFIQFSLLHHCIWCHLSLLLFGFLCGSCRFWLVRRFSNQHQSAFMPFLWLNFTLNGRKILHVSTFIIQSYRKYNHNNNNIIKHYNTHTHAAIFGLHFNVKIYSKWREIKQSWQKVYDWMLKLIYLNDYKLCTCTQIIHWSCEVSFRLISVMWCGAIQFVGLWFLFVEERKKHERHSLAMHVIFGP